MDVEIEKPHVHHHKTGHRWLDLALPIAALFVSFVSIYIAWHHGQVMKELVHQNEKLVEANSLPYLQVDGSNARGHITYEATNEGVGPAKIMTAEVFVDGRPVDSLKQLMDVCCREDGTTGLITSSLTGRMVRAGDHVTYIDLPYSSANVSQAAALDKARQSRVVTRLCYCSVFDDCWIASSRDPTPDAVKQCAPPAHPYKD